MRRLAWVASRSNDEPRLLLRYIGAGTIAALTEFSLFTVLYQVVEWSLLAANCVAFAIAVVICFALQKNWTFQVKGAADRQLRLYLLMQAISAVLNNALMLLLVAGLGVYASVAKLIEIGIVFLWNYTFCRFVVFAKVPTRE